MLLDSYVTCIIKNIYPKFDNRVNKKKVRENRKICS